MKKFIIKILCLIFIISSLYLVISFSIKNTITNITSLGNLNNTISNKIIESITGSLTELSTTELNQVKAKIVHDNRINIIINKYTELLLKDIQNNTVSEIDVSNEINAIINDSMENIPNSFKKYVYEKANTIDFNGIYKNLLDYAKTEIRVNLKPYIKVFSILTSTLYRILAILGVFISLGLIYVLSKPKYEMLSTLGITCLLFGAIYFILSIFLKQVFSYLASSMLGTNLSISFGSISIISILFFLIGFTLKDIYETKIEKK